MAKDVLNVTEKTFRGKSNKVNGEYYRTVLYLLWG